MRKYELLFVLPGTLDDKEAGQRSQEILNMVKEHGSEVELVALGKNRLAYPIRQIRYGYFYTVIFNAEPEKVKELEGKLTLTRDLLRSIVTHFNTQLTANQKIAYTTNEIGVTTMVEKRAEEQRTPAVAEAVVTPAAPAKPEVKVDISDISKKLDEILGGDIIPGI